MDGIRRRPLQRRNIEKDKVPLDETAASAAKEKKQKKHQKPAAAKRAQRVESPFDFSDITAEEARERRAKRSFFRRRFAKLTLKKFFVRFTFFGAAAVLIMLGVNFWNAAGQIIDRGDNTGALALQDDIDATQLKGEGDGRVNILLIGVDKSTYLSDTMIVTSIDPLTNDVAMLSIPRDLYAPIPGYGSSRLNAAHSYGEQYEGKGGGPRLLRETLQEVLGIPIHYHIKVDFQGFTRVVDAIGGVNVNVEETINDPTYPDARQIGYDPLYIPEGQHHFNGDTALKYARSRHSSRGDFDRSERQQKILKIIKDKALGLGTLSNPVRLNELISAAGNHVRTDLSLNEMLKLAKIAENVNNEQIINASLVDEDNSLLTGRAINGASVLIPKAGVGNFTEIQTYARSLFIDGFIRNEDAKIRVLNGTDRLGLASRTAALLESYGYQVEVVGNAPQTTFAQTQIHDHANGNSPYTLRYLEQRFSVKALNGKFNDPDNPEENAQVDITIILGDDYEEPS